jgi:hypothetical protein
MLCVPAFFLLSLSCKVLVLSIFFHKSSSTPSIDAAGLISAVAGLVLFLEGLRVAIMPMALLVGNQLPLKLKLPWVLLVAFCLGVVSAAAVTGFSCWAVVCQWIIGGQPAATEVETCPGCCWWPTAWEW